MKINNNILYTLEKHNNNDNMEISNMFKRICVILYEGWFEMINSNQNRKKKIFLCEKSKLFESRSNIFSKL